MILVRRIPIFTRNDSAETISFRHIAALAYTNCRNSGAWTRFENLHQGIRQGQRPCRFSHESSKIVC